MPQQSRSVVMSSNSHIDTAYSLSLLSEYNHTLDSLPLDLSRNFADLRELDAVLSTAMASITTKIHNLTQMIEDGKGKEERLWLLSEIAEEARTLKPGGEDKIRVACQAADNLKSHMSHLRTLAEHIPGFDASVLNRQTTYPHVASKTFMPVTMTEGGRRRRGNYGSLLTSATDPSPVKRKRVPRDDDGTPRKERAVDGPSRPRNGGRGRRNERAGSPADSVLSVTSYMPPQPPQASSRGGSAHGRTNGTGHTHGGNRRSRTAANSRRGGSPQNEHYPNGTYDHGLPNHGSRREAFNVPPSASHPSLPLPYHTNGNPHPFELHIPNGAPLGGVVAGPGEWPMPRQLEGPGVPVPRNPAAYSEAGMPMNVGSGAEDEGTVEQDGEADGDNRRYCVCDGYSYGDMIACDDSNCEREWFHLTCIGLEVPPEGKWYCDNCSNKKPVKRPGRGGKRRGGHRAGAGRGTT